jgi:tyrosinase
MSRTAASKMSATNPTPVPTPINLPYVITGIPTVPSPNGEVPIRQDCDTWSQAKANADQANLFILALRFYVDMDPLDRDSFWQTAGMFFFFRPPLLIITWLTRRIGIHGLPYMPWNESTLPQSVPVLGYCTHNSVLFPSWHRPYVALFEVRTLHVLLSYETG